MIIWPGAMNFILAADCMCQRKQKFMRILARGHEFIVGLLIACVSEKYMIIWPGAMNLMFGC